MVDRRYQVMIEGIEMAEDDIDVTNRELEELNREVIARGGQP